MMLPTYDCFDCANAAAARDLFSADASGTPVAAMNVIRDRASSGHAYKEELVEVFGTGYTIADARMMWPQNHATPVSPLFLANEIYTFTAGTKLRVSPQVSKSSHQTVYILEVVG